MSSLFSIVTYAKKVALLLTQAAHVNPPAIQFRRQKPKDDDASDEDEKIKKIKIKLDPDDDDSDEFEARCFIFETGEAEKWVKWRIQMDELVRDVPLNDGEKKIKYSKALLAGEARERFTNIVADLRHAAQGGEEEDAEDTYNEAIERLGHFYFGSEHAYRRQKSYLRYHVFMMEMSLVDFRAELLRQNNMLQYFPVPDDRTKCDVFEDDELVEILDRAKRVEWQLDLLTANINPYLMSLDQYYKYLEKLEAKYEMDKHLRSERKEKDKHKTHGSTDQSKGDKNGDQKRKRGKDRSKGENKRKEACKHCGKFHPAPDEKCWSLPANAKEPPNKRQRSSGENMFSALQMEAVVKALAKKEKKIKNRKKEKDKSLSM